MIENLINTFCNHYTSKGHKLSLPYSLTHPAFKTSFLFSAGFVDLKDVISGYSKPLKRMCVIQPCFRFHDINNLQSNTHLSLFLMGGALFFNDFSKNEVLITLLDLLTKEVDIKKERIWISIFNGGIISNNYIKKENEIEQTWIDYGLDEKKIVYGDINNNFWFEGRNTGQLSSGICGPSYEIFIDSSLNTNCVSENCNPTCNCGRFIEVATIVFPTYIRRNQDLLKINLSIGELVIGFERLLMIIEKKHNIFNISQFLDLKNQIKASIETISFNEVLTNNLIELIRSFYCLVAEGAKPGRKGRGHFMRKLFKRIYYLLSEITDDPISMLKYLGSLVINDIHLTYNLLSKNHSYFIEHIIDIEYQNLVKQTPSNHAVGF